MGLLAAVAAVLLTLAPDPTGIWPLDPRPEVVATFAPPALPWGSGHRGVDLGGRVGQPVRAALAGEVVFAGRIAGRGVVVVRHGETRTTFEPVAARAEPGEVVAPGTVLGRLELAGSHCFPRACLHWGWIENATGTYLDPLRLVGVGPVRLLPLWREGPGSPLPRADAPVRLAGALAGRPDAGGQW